MFRALLELIITILVAFVARSLLSSIMKGVTRAAQTASREPQGGGGPRNPQEQAAPPKEANKSGVLHKDPICGTYVSESTSFRRVGRGQTFYYCSEVCRQKHAA